ncbi:MAG: hypothetical protein IPG92_13980 [Flavobacteriales bacterium]|nr:hypothetical protein [Flavobacteriales bacterium]
MRSKSSEHLPYIATPINPDWLRQMVEACGYTGYEVVVSYRMDIPLRLPEVYHRHRRALPPEPCTIEFRFGPSVS